MKKVISLVLAVLMLFSAFAFVGSAVSVSDDNYVSLVFNYLSYDVGNIYYGTPETVDEGPMKGCIVIRGAMCTPGNFVQLPGIKNPPEGYSGAWFLSSSMATGAQAGNTYACGSMFQIPENAKLGEYIVFTATTAPIEQTSTIVKIVRIFAKVIGVLFGTDAANKFLDIIGQVITLD
ncbi:MAG: hypothetical protein ACI4GA_01380 [Acutalibacteraceae bacterium]